MTKAFNSIRTAVLAIAAVVATPTFAAMSPQQGARPITHVRLFNDRDVAMAATDTAAQPRTQSDNPAPIDPWTPLQCVVTKARATC